MCGQLNIAVIGSGFMGRAHSIAYQVIPRLFPVQEAPCLHTLVDISESLASQVAERYGFAHWSTDWAAVVADPDIDVVSIAVPNDMHKEIAIRAVQHGKHVYCEKPLAPNSLDATAMYEAAKAANVCTAVGFNYRKNPAALAMKELIDSGALGRIYHFRGWFLQDWAVDPDVPLSWRFNKAISGSGSLGDLGSHVIDFARYLIGEVSGVCALTETYIRDRPVSTSALDAMGTGSKGDRSRRGPVDVDDAFVSLLRFENGAIGTLEATRLASGRKCMLALEINGSGGSLYFNHESMNEFQVYLNSDKPETSGFRRVLVGPNHPYFAAYWPVAGTGIGFQDTKTIDMYEFIQQIQTAKPSTASFHDGWAVSRVTDAIGLSAAENRWVSVDEIRGGVQSESGPF